jgi:hypothetical protein
MSPTTKRWARIGLPVVLVVLGVPAAIFVPRLLNDIASMKAYVYGFPLVMMDVTKDVLTATDRASEYKAPMNQWGRIRTYVDPDFKDVVRISVNSLWSHIFLDLDREPMILSVPDTGGITT